jgi:hypothetical protein
MNIWIINYKHWDGKIGPLKNRFYETESQARLYIKNNVDKYPISPEINIPVNIQEVSINTDLLLMKLMTSYSLDTWRSEIIRLIWNEDACVKFSEPLDINE